MIQPVTQKTIHIRLWVTIVAILVGLGVVFRVANLGEPVYWVDEVATSMRVSGYTQAEVVQRFATGEPLTPAEVLEVQQIRGDRPRSDLIRVFTQSPEHAPLYFILMRFWAEIFGTSVIAMRSFSVVLSLLALPAIFALSRTLFQNPTNTKEKRIGVDDFNRRGMAMPCPYDDQPIALPCPYKDVDTDGTIISWTALGLLAISPYFVSYAQEARPYSLWVLLLLLENQMLWRSLHSNRIQIWVSYGLALILTLYTSLLTVPIVAGQALMVMLLHPHRRRSYLAATVLAGIAFLPWCWIVIQQWQTLQENTAWTQVSMPLWALLGVMIYSVAVLFFDVPVAAGIPVILGLQILMAIATLALISYGILYLLRRTPKTVGLFIFTHIITVPAVLVILDLIRNGQSAATPRYLIPTQLGILLAMAYLLSKRLFPPSRRWRFITAVVLSISLLSCLIGVSHTSTYQKSRNLSNPAIVALVNQERSPHLIAEADQLQDIISLSYALNPDTRIYVLPPVLPPEEWFTTLDPTEHSTFVFNPSASLTNTIQRSELGQLQEVYQPQKLIEGELGLTLWKIDGTED
ncbi:MAG: hypothetical protein VKL39_04985 [Leptolyngbyaceae bacterium]|nr:hypothetical protein [Leptolyngbyaceae bacterium]